jgi:2-polyprenyl-6-methoxyphenol hydroxylase-like FAD-dependent oxidoreductase
MNGAVTAGSRTVVLGAGVAGLAAAAALRHTGDVLVVDRDAVTDGTGPRPGVPQAAQLHNLLGRAQQSLERLLPGYCDELVRAGGCRARAGSQTHVFELGRRMPERDLGFDLMSAPRILIEQVMRRMLVARGHVHFRTARAVGLTSDRDRVTGVVVETPTGTDTLVADLVVDATGAGSQALAWLDALDQQRPPVHVATAAHWYVTATFARPDVWRGRDDFWMVFPSPAATRGALLSPGADGTWRVSLFGAGEDVPPATHADAVVYASNLEDPMIGRTLSGALPVGRTTLFRKPTATWRRYDALERPLAGLLPIGDAVAGLDPLFGQGISVGTWQAAMLADLLDGPPSSLRRLTTDYLRAAAWACRSAWDLGRLVVAAAPDLAGRISGDAAAHRAYVEAWHLLRPVPAAAAATI